MEARNVARALRHPVTVVGSLVDTRKLMKLRLYCPLTHDRTGGDVAASLTPYLANHFGWMASFMVAAALCLIGSLSWLMVNPEAQIVAAPAKRETPVLSNS